jgi:hypothetical protein
MKSDLPTGWRIVRTVCSVTLLLVPLVPFVFIVFCTWAAVEQRIYLSKVLSVLQEVSSPDDPRMKAIERTDSLGFDSGSCKMKLRDGWVILFSRQYATYDYGFGIREMLEHRIIICKDSSGNIYVKAQGFFPPDDVDEKGAGDFGLSGNESVSNYFKDEKSRAHQGSGWDFWEVKK